MEALAQKFGNVGVYVVAQAAVLPVIYWLTPRCVEDRVTLSNDIILCFMLPVMLYTAFAGAYSLSGSIELRWFGTSAEALLFLELYIAHQSFSCAVDIASARHSWRSKVGIIAHHVTSIVCFAAGILNQRMHFWACFDALCESSTPFLKIVNVATAKGGDFGERFKARLGPLWAVNAVSLWLAYIVFRLALFPVWLCWFLYDLHRMEGAMRSKLTYFETCAMPVTTVFLLILSFIWFQRIHAGVVKAVQKVFGGAKGS